MIRKGVSQSGFRARFRQGAFQFDPIDPDRRRVAVAVLLLELKELLTM